MVIHKDRDSPILSKLKKQDISLFFHRVGENKSSFLLLLFSSSHTTRHTVPYQGGSLLTIQLYDNNPLEKGS